jgi:hypothetical protein
MFKVGDKVKAFRWPGDWEIVYIAHKEDLAPYLCVSYCNNNYSTSWFRESEFESKFKAGEVWETRDGEKRVNIVSVCNDYTVRYPVIGIFNANTSVASSSGFTYDGHYDYNVKEDPLDLVKKIS